MQCKICSKMNSVYSDIHASVLGSTLIHKRFAHSNGQYIIPNRVRSITYECPHHHAQNIITKEMKYRWTHCQHLIEHFHAAECSTWSMKTKEIRTAKILLCPCNRRMLSEHEPIFPKLRSCPIGIVSNRVCTNLIKQYGKQANKNSS